MIDPALSVSLRCLLALLFATAAWHKATDLARFGATLEAYRLVPKAMAQAATRGLPWVEILVAVALVTPFFRWGAFGAIALLVLYTSAVMVNLGRGRREIDCGCFGPAAKIPLSGRVVARNAILILAASVATLPIAARRLVWIDTFAIAAVVITTGFVWATFWRLREVATAMEGST